MIASMPGHQSGQSQDILTLGRIRLVKVTLYLLHFRSLNTEDQVEDPVVVEFTLLWG
jgi:hypothetical protein